MKKIYMVLLIALFTLVGCSSSNKNVKNQTNNTSGLNTSQKTANNVMNDAEKVVGDIGNNVGRAANDIGNTITGRNSNNNMTNTATTNNNMTNTATSDNNMMNRTTNNNMANRTTNDDNYIRDKTANNNTINRTSTESGIDMLNGYNQSNVNARNITNTTNNVASDDLSQRATKIAKALNKIDGVEKATVVITGEVALIGLNIANDISDEQITKIKKEAEQQTLNTDTAIKNVAITAAPEIVDRIVNVAGDIGNGKPLSGLADELGSLIRRITPTM